MRRPSRPVGRVLYPAGGGTVTINLGPRLLGASSGQPGSLGRAPLALPYLALLRAGFSRPPAHAEAGGLLPHHFTLTLPRKGGMFLCHFPSGRPAWVLPSALPVGARTFLPEQVRSGHPAYWVSFDYTSPWLPARPRLALTESECYSGAVSRARLASWSALLF